MEQNFNTVQSRPPEPEFHGKGAFDAFLNLLSLVTLGWTAISFGGVIFQIINKYLGNPAFHYDEGYYSGVIKFHIASLLIVTPVYLVLTGILHRQYREKKLNEKSGIHRWLTYFMLFVAFCNIVGSLVALVFKFLDGIFFSSFILKALTILVIALGIFGYTWFDLRRKNYSARSQISTLSAVLVSVFALGAIVWSFFIMGSPLRARMLNYDRQRVQDLSSLSYAINNYVTANKKLPADFSEPQFVPYKDPETQEPYEYRVLNEKEYELCAVFSLDAESANNPKYPMEYYARYESWYYHKKGRQCYKLEGKDTSPTFRYYEPKPNPVPVN